MPIRFRCVYCEKLLGIARRKAGAVVNCPHCSEKLIVPTPEPSQVESSPEQLAKESEEEQLFAGGGPQLFERSDFEALLQSEPTFRSNEEPSPAALTKRNMEPPPVAASMPKPKARSANGPAELAAAGFDVSTPEGVFINTSKMTWLGVAGVILLALAFTAGLFVGRYFR